MSQPPPTNRPGVLIVEDDPWIRDFTRNLLVDEGYAVVSAPEGKAGLAAIERARPAVIVLDLAMPRLTGAEFLQRLRRNPATSEIPVIVASGDTATLLPNIASLADVILGKPVDVGELLAYIQRALSAGRSGLKTVGGSAA
jgi:CheY-like chemotaxis protein